MKVEFSPSILDDIPQIAEWASYDPYHFMQTTPEFWLTGAEGSLLTFCLTDEKGPLCYVRIDPESGFARVHIQFAPESVVSKRRLVVGLLMGLGVMKGSLPDAGMKGMIFNTINPALANFFIKQGFKSVGNDDYRLDF